MLGIKEDTNAIKTGPVIADDWSANWSGSVAVKITALVVWIVVAYSFVTAVILLNKTTSELKEKINYQAEHVAHAFATYNYHPDNKSNLDELKIIIIKNGFLAARVLSYKDDKKWIGNILSNEKIRQLTSISQSLSIPGYKYPDVTLELFHTPYKQLAENERIKTLIVIVLSILGFGFTHVYITSRVLKRPFQAIEEAAQEVINGDLSIRMDAQRQDEFGRLATFFNNMLDRVQSDHTELKETLEYLQKTQKQLIKSQQEADSANEAKSMFLANMSHEIRTPMNAILGYTQILQCDESLGDEQQTSIKAIGRSGNHLLSLINNILDISKIEAGRMELIPVDFYINELIEDLSEMFRLHCQKNHLEWNISTNLTSESLAVHGDEGKLRQVLINLLSNAVKFTADGSVKLSLKKTSGNKFIFEVIDTGPGIPEHALKRIFEIFQQDEQGRKKGGSGLGLAISEKQIAFMGGTLNVESTPGQGSRFSFSLYLPPAIGSISERIAENTMPKLAPGVHIKALVVDDIPENRDVMIKILTKIGVEVQQAEDGPSSIIIAEQFLPDIIFMDYVMPGINGIQAIEKIRGKIKKEFKAVIVTASTFSLIATQFDNCKIDIAQTIIKPFTVQEILSTLSNLLNARFIEGNTPVTDNKVTEDGSTQNFSSIKIPAALIDQLKVAAEFNLITEIEDISVQIRQLGNEYLPLSKLLDKLIRSFDIAEIQRLTEELTCE